MAVVKIGGEKEMNWVKKRYANAEYVFAGRAYSEITCSACGCEGFYIGFDGESFVSKCRDCGNKTMMAKELVKEESEKEAKKDGLVRKKVLETAENIIEKNKGIMNHYDKNGQFKFNTEILDRQNSLAVRIDKLEKQAKKGEKGA